MVIKDLKDLNSSRPHPLRWRLVGWLKRKRKILLATSLVLLSFAGGGLYNYLARKYSLPVINPMGLFNDEPVIVLSSTTLRNQPHPITGVFYTKKEKEAWEKHRPLAIMIDNHGLARKHQFGLQEADLIWEAVAEGGITRFLAVFHSQDVKKIGPVRSSRVYYIDWALEFPAYYAHVGGAGTIGSPANIFVYIAQKGVLDLDKFKLGAATYWSGGKIMLGGNTILAYINYTSTDKLWEGGKKLYPGTNKLPDFDSWKFKADAPYDERPKSQKRSFDFWYPGTYSVTWKYNKDTNSYLRWQGGKKHLDQATKKQLLAKNVVLLYTGQRSAGDGTAHLLHDTTGSGKAAVYLDGKAIKATWKRSTLSDRTEFYKRGKKKEIEFNRGLTWVEVLPE